MQLKQVSTQTQYSIFSYLNYRSTQFAPRNIFQEQTILNLLTPPLRQQLLFESHTSFIQNSHFLSEIFSPSFIYKLPSIIQELRVDPGEIIYRDNYVNLNDNNLYIVQQGEVDIQYQCDCHISQGSSKYCNYQKKNNESSECFLVTKTLKKNDMLGFSLFFYPYSGRILRAKATTFTELLFINYKSFIDLLQQFPNDYEKFCYIRDEITINKNYSIIGQTCYFCGDDSHLIRNCNQIHYELNFEQKKNMFYQSSFQLQRVSYQRLRKIKNKRIKLNEEEMIKYQKFKMKKLIALNQYSYHFKLNTQSSMSDLEDPLLESEIKQLDQSKKKINYKSKTLDQQTSIKVGGSQPSSQQHLQHKQESQYKKQISSASSQSINFQQFTSSNQQATQDQYQSDSFIDDPSQSDKQDAYLLHQNKQNQESKKELQQQNSSIADSMILELKPSSYNNLFERTKGEMDNNKNQKKIQKIKLYPHNQRSSSQIPSQIQQCQSPQLQQNHLTINQTSNFEKRKNSYLQYDSRHSLDSNLMKLLYPTNKFNENGTQIYDNIFTQTVLQNMPAIQQVGNTNTMHNFNNAITNQTCQSNQQHNQLMEDQSELGEQTGRKMPSIALKIGHNTEQISQELQYQYDDCSICDFQYYYPYWNHEFVIELINSNYLANTQNNLNRDDNIHNKKYSSQGKRNSNIKQPQLVCSFYQLHSKNKKNTKIVQCNLKSGFEQNLAINGQSMLANYNDISNLPLQSNYFNMSFDIGKQSSNSQTINWENPQQQMVIQNIQYPQPQQIQYSFHYKNSHLKNQHIEQHSFNPIQKIPTDFKPKMKEFHEDLVGKNNNNQDNNQDQQSEFLSNNNIPYNNQKSRELKFVESQYSFSKPLGLSKDRRKSDANAITSHFNIKNKTLDNGTYDDNQQVDQETNTFDNQKSDTDYQYIQSLKDQQNLVYSHYNSTKNENIYDSDQSNRFNTPNNFTFQVRRQKSNSNS
ncbi:cyclic nucleotide-binding domain protein (macronuclear) [Tetrahymena thermophila SB210]|uniref:Cyclic nucleotide-binding domain protein n=1 Tax=Tetrahymena thermophila (strain SB210) TaxID=312017 RepID=Q22W84_TETTS|nr:cyclic nucleotide-binding domain protein [Tetrahymena thermophila SB210]EAR89533.2 cyclic nucleotide-binding domain protein [Tetrahymena thermophila SB210]|eukprot:XP_001009778.2 cyclic nucleotide-binding domain protein [Tetrahymena thermophila SB210]